MNTNSVTRLINRFGAIVARRPFLSAAIAAAAAVAASSPGDDSPDGPSKPRSADARRAAELMEAGSVGGALQVLEDSLGRSSADAEVLGQYARCLILARDPANPNFIQTPLVKGGEHYWAAGVAADAADKAAELEPSLKPELARSIFHAFHQRVKTALADGSGCIGVPRDLYFPETGLAQRCSGISLSMINLCWKAIGFDPEAAREWSHDYEILAGEAARRGKVASAMMLGNLAGDMRQGGKGSEDFRMANAALLDALQHHVEDPSHDFLRDVVEAYPDCFRDELLGDEGRNDPLFGKLCAELASRGYRIGSPGPVSRGPFASGAAP